MVKMIATVVYHWDYRDVQCACRYAFAPPPYRMHIETFDVHISDFIDILAVWRTFLRDLTNAFETVKSILSVQNSAAEMSKRAKTQYLP